jgi:hypothetical protein
MCGWRAGLIGGLGLVAAGCRAPPPAPEPSPAEVRTALALAVGLLEAKDHAGFVERFPPPTAAADPAAQLARLRQVRGSEPTFADRGATAVFEAGAARVVFRRVGGVWYLDWA